MPRPTQENVRSLPDFATAYNWNLEIQKTPAGVRKPPNFNWQVQTSTIPTASNTPIEVDIRGHKIRQSGIQQYDGTLDIQVVETVDVPFRKFIRDWRECQWETNTGKAKPRNESSCDFTLTTADRQDSINQTFQIIGGILTNYTLGDLSGDASEVLRPTLTVTYDYFKDDV